ncbi:PE-PPE domain-containing protein [Mycolicibacterium thermoresistibile]
MTADPTPPRVGRAKAAAAAVATTAALTLGVTAPTIQNDAHQQIVRINDERMLNADVELSAIAGMYGVGPIFWIADTLGITPENVVLAAAGLLDSPIITDAVQSLFDVLGLVVDIDAPGPLPGDVYNAVNGLDYTTDLILDLVPAGLRNMELGWVAAETLNILLGTDLFSAGQTIGAAVRAFADQVPILKQRRAIIFAEGLGGLTASLAYRDMIEAVTADDPDWEPGVTAQWMVFVNNPSRPGGGLFALATPFTEMLGWNLSTPAGGSYTNDPDDPTKILNTSVLDVAWAYNILSDAPSTLNPLAWANAAAGGIFLTYLIPDDLNLANTNLPDQLLPLTSALANGLAVLVDPTGGQGTRVIPLLGDLIDELNDLPFVNIPHVPGLEGRSTYITYDPGNLPLLEPFDVLPRMLGLLGLNVPQPVLNSVENALRMAVNTGYQDVDPVTLERGFDAVGEQAVLGQSVLTPSQQFDAGWTIANTLVDDIQAHLLNPVAWTPSVAGQPLLNDALRALIQNAVAIAASELINTGIDAVQGFSDAAFDQVRTGLTPLLDIADDLNRQSGSGTGEALRIDNHASAPALGSKRDPVEAPSSTKAAEGASLITDIDIRADETADTPVKKRWTPRHTRNEAERRDDNVGTRSRATVERPAGKSTPSTDDKADTDAA